MQGEESSTKACAKLVPCEAFVALMQRQLAATNGILDPSQALARAFGVVLNPFLLKASFFFQPNEAFAWLYIDRF